MIRYRLVNMLWLLSIVFALHLWAGLVPSAQAQGSRKDDIVFNSRGIPARRRDDSTSARCRRRVSLARRSRRFILTRR